MLDRWRAAACWPGSGGLRVSGGTGQRGVAHSHQRVTPGADPAGPSSRTGRAGYLVVVCGAAPGELADGGASARSRAVGWCCARQEARELSACTIPVDRVDCRLPPSRNHPEGFLPRASRWQATDDLEHGRPGTRLVISSRGRRCRRRPRAATAPAVRAVRTPISRASRSVVGRAHENFATNRSPMTALDECHSSRPCPHYSSSWRSPAGRIADAKSAAATRPRAADPTSGNSSPLGPAYRESSAQIRPLCAACRYDQAILEEAPNRRSAPQRQPREQGIR